MNVLARYLSEIRKTHSLGSVPETSYYPALAELLNTVGQGLRPRVTCIVHPKSQGVGIPDLALYTADQVPANGGEPLPNVLPARGVIEAKGAGDDVDKIAASRQVTKYLERYGQVLVTNLREFVRVGRGEDGKPAIGERFTLAASAPALWDSAQTTDAAHGPFVDFLKRALLSDAPLEHPRDVAWLLAYYAREARARVEAHDLEALTQLRQGMEEALGIAFTGERGEHFFRSTLVQTLFYGIFSAWVLWHQRGAAGSFRWKEAAFELRVPMIRSLFYQAADPNRLEPLGLVEVLDWAGGALNRVDRDAFFARFAAEYAVQYFYEPFLEAFDPELRRELGVWYTPREIVRYQVARVDAVLREELGVADGLADPNVVVLDPCCGTGAYLVEVVRLIHERLAAGGSDALTLDDVKKAATSRIYGFEILPAPFVVAHLQMGLLLQGMGASLSAQKNERVGVFLTNALTGWEGEPPQKAMIFPELAAERDAAYQVKHKPSILVVLGNPPYNGYAGIALDEERGLSDAYRTTKNAPRPQGQGLNDLYVRFFRMAERRIVEQTGKGVVCFISNYSWLDGLSFTGMRERYAEVFDRIWIDNCNGDKYRTGKVTPDGKPDPSVFSTQYNREGIQVGTAIATLVRKSPHTDGAEIQYREFWGKDKLAKIEAANAPEVGPAFRPLNPPISIGMPFAPQTVDADFVCWPSLPELLPISFPGVKTSRDDLVIDVDHARLSTRIATYFDRGVSDEVFAGISHAAMEDSARFQARAIRRQLQTRGILPQYLIRYQYRPLDTRWIYWEPQTKLLDEKRPEYFPHVTAGNIWLSAGQRNRKSDFYQPQITPFLADHHIVESNVSMFPLKLKLSTSRDLFDDFPSAENTDGTNWNLSDAARAYLTNVWATATNADRLV